jgi:hypothetical protein
MAGMRGMGTVPEKGEVSFQTTGGVGEAPEPDGPTGGPSDARCLSNGRFLTAAFAIVLVALAVRVYRIGEPALRFDEAYSFSMVALPNWLPRALADVNPPLYYLVLRAWVGLFGHSEAALRALSAGLGTLFVVAVIWAAREILGSHAALWSGAFAALAPQHLYYSQDARAYTLLTLTLVLSYVALWRAMSDDSWKWWGVPPPASWWHSTPIISRRSGCSRRPRCSCYGRTGRSSRDSGVASSRQP